MISCTVECNMSLGNYPPKDVLGFTLWCASVYIPSSFSLRRYTAVFLRFGCFLRYPIINYKVEVAVCNYHYICHLRNSLKLVQSQEVHVRTTCSPDTGVFFLANTNFELDLLKKFERCVIIDLHSGLPSNLLLYSLFTFAESLENIIS